jgi:hypothetical protein
MSSDADGGLVERGGYLRRRVRKDHDGMRLPAAASITPGTRPVLAEATQAV